ncbi:TIGR02647 family protein [Marinobacter sp. M3C]|jgi:uncharacterized protein (TIGR02647 family)|uniref:TIGR02647 family protein n=1 Tax=unclassified Marinobacter TaxID=83889 RepID=UPI00200FF97A|nr:MULTISPECIES: TIGR02647 family protein [unclassified Marinobacter]MCL1477634.1 TIGR02647 family protein [Marinobacter sp.]MCL1480933.1 TIGR02647 family protein [Marinobacter sp.]MCL1483263.1 TIGR02647 family protein [Marinobacter sp.]MCL1487143.1 TIGR02647 family protein [Marinobacter sp.]UQG54814.1 TIGR02647 family protein [Marinobacter sp. M4C]
MSFSANHLAELNLLTQFHSSSAQEGIKVHRNEAAPELVSAAERLFSKGLITRDDGGYLTTLGSEAIEQAQMLLAILTSK